jgi:hypothetical protein
LKNFLENIFRKKIGKYFFLGNFGNCLNNNKEVSFGELFYFCLEPVGESCYGFQVESS